MDLIKPLAGKVALVTASAKGIGKAIALRLASDGARLVINYVNSKSEAEQVVGAIATLGGEAIAVRADVSVPAEVRSLFDATVSKFGRLDIVVLSAGTGTRGPLAQTPDEEFDRVFALNAKGVFVALKEAANRIADGGAIINISTALTVNLRAGSALVAASKAAGELLAATLAKELGGRGISVNTVSPGATDTETMARVITPEARRMIEQQTPLGRIGTPEDIANVVGFLVGPSGRWVTGQTIQASGGSV